MWLIKRVYMDGAGHEEAFYKDLTLDYIGLSQAVSSPVVEGLRSPVRNATVVTSTYQQLVNGGGKSTYIALLLSIFEPSVSDFTQYLANHRQSEYHYRMSHHVVMIFRLSLLKTPTCIIDYANLIKFRLAGHWSFMAQVTKFPVRRSACHNFLRPNR